MFTQPSPYLKARLDGLEDHLERENPLLVEGVRDYRELDRLGYRLGLLSADESYATKISWWPLISVLGTFSAGKSTFINDYLGFELQETGNQAVDDKFTVICYSEQEGIRELPGLALDSDPRFPFYQIGEEIEKVAPGEGSRIEAYLQLKTCNADRLSGKILIDSPGFDADEQRNSTLRLTDHIMDLSDLVIVLFDARHPEPGAMHDTLQHLVRNTIRRNDVAKFVFVLNQIDTSAHDDNAEDVVAAWQRALANAGLTAGRFYAIFSPNAGTEIEDANLRARYEGKRDQDLATIYSRIEEVGIQRIYRIIGSLDNLTNEIENVAVPRLKRAMNSWKRGVLALDGLALALLVVLFLAISIGQGWWDGLSLDAGWWHALTGNAVLATVVAVLLVVVLIAGHFSIRRLVAGRIARRLAREEAPGDLAAAFEKNTVFWRSIFRRNPAGWGRRSRNLLRRLRQSADDYVQRLNDRFTDPSGAAAARKRGATTPSAFEETGKAQEGEDRSTAGEQRAPGSAAAGTQESPAGAGRGSAS